MKRVLLFVSILLAATIGLSACGTQEPLP
ncbi:MAG: hypothetical protein H6Q38_237, partial [Chloroflexi bacterium]|nr:hypothetical protein [Chloroflexota bacterium]